VNEFKHILSQTANINFGYGNITTSKGNWFGRNKQKTIRFDMLEDINENSGINTFGKAERALSNRLKEQIRKHPDYKNFSKVFDKNKWPDMLDDKKMALFLMYRSTKNKQAILNYIVDPTEITYTSTKFRGNQPSIKNKAVPQELSGFTRGGRSRKQRRHKASSTKRRR